MFGLGGGLEVRVKEIPNPGITERASCPDMLHMSRVLSSPERLPGIGGPLLGQKSPPHAGKGGVEVSSPQGRHWRKQHLAGCLF